MVSCHFQTDFVGMGARNKFAANRNQLYMSCNSTKLIFINLFIDLGVDNHAPKRAKGAGGRIKKGRNLGILYHVFSIFRLFMLVGGLVINSPLIEINFICLVTPQN